MPFAYAMLMPRSCLSPAIIIDVITLMPFSPLRHADAAITLLSIFLRHIISFAIIIDYLRAPLLLLRFHFASTLFIAFMPFLTHIIVYFH